MTVDITQEELDLFTKNGISQDDIRQTINNYRSDGLSDIDIRAKFDNKLNSFRGQRSGYTYPNQDVKNMNPEEFKRTVDTLYDIPQVPIPQRGTLVNSDGVPMETVADVMSNTVDPSKKTFAQSHPVIASVPEAVGTFGRAAKKSYYDFGTGVNDLLTLAGDKTGIKGLSDFGRSNAQFWQQRSGDVDQRINDKYQKLAGLTDASTVLPTIANAIGSQATNLLMAAGGGAGAGTLAKAAGLGKVGTGIATTAGTAVPNLAQEGQYLDKIEAFKNIYGRVPTEEELRVIQNVAMGEKATNAALETISDKLLFGKLFPQGVATKGAKDVLKNVGKQAVTEAGTEGMQESVSIGAEKLLGINQGNNLERLGEAIGMGGLTGGILGGSATLASQPYDSQITAEPVEALKEVSAQILDNGKAIYDSANQQSGFDALRQISKEGAYTNPSVEEIAPNTYQKQQAKKAPVVKNWDIEALPHITSEEAQNVKNWDIEALPRVKAVEEQIAPKTAAKQQAKALEKAEKAESNYEQVMEEARNHTIKTGEQTRVTKNDNGMYEYEVVKPEVANVDAKIAELERKMKLVGGEKTQLGQKYKRQIEELRGTEQANEVVAPVAEEVKPVTEEPVENVPSKTEEAPKSVETEEVVAPKTETVEPVEEIQGAEITKATKPATKKVAKAKRTSEDVSKERRAYQDEVFEKFKNGTLTEEERLEYLKKDKEFEDERKSLWTKEHNEQLKKLEDAKPVEKPKKTTKKAEKSTKTIEDSGETEVVDASYSLDIPENSKDITKTKEFKKWFGNSKVVEENGKPLVVYHGTNIDFDEFKNTNKRYKTKYGKNNTKGIRGFYFTPDIKSAKIYSEVREGNPIIKEFYLSLKNPIIYNNYTDIAKITDEKVEELKAQGYDGAIYFDRGEFGKTYASMTEYVAFEPEQIKSVNNRGTFDAEDPNIYRYIGIPDFMVNNSSNTQKAFFMQGKVTVYDGRQVATLKDIRTNKDYDAVKDFFDAKDDNIEIRLLEPGYEDQIAYFRRGENCLYVRDDVTPEILVHEYTHFLDYKNNGDNIIYKVEHYLYNTKGKGVDELRKHFFEGIAIENEEIALKRLQGDKNVKFRRPTNTFKTLLQKVTRGEIGISRIIRDLRTYKRAREAAKRGKGTSGKTPLFYPNNIHKTLESSTKERGAIKTLNKYDKEMADAITEKEYEVRSLDKVAEEIRNMSEKELDDVLNSDRSTDTKSLALAQSIKSSIDNGEVPVTKLNKWAIEGTDIGQAMQARKAIAPETVEEAVIKMHTYNTENVKPTVKKLINDSDKIVKEMTNEEIEKQFNEWLAKQDETPAKKQYSQYGDRLALLKAMERYRNTKERQKIREFQRNEERKRKAVERLVNERLKNSDRKVRADLIDNILKLENNDGLTSDNVAKLIMKMFKIKTISPADVAELKKLSSKIKNASTQRDEDIAKAMMQKYIIDNSIGSSAWDKINAIRYINMLGGTVQRILDFASTGVYQVLRLGDNFVTLVIDKAASKALGTEQVTSGFYAPEYFQGFKQGVKEGYFDTVHGINTGRAGETARYDLNKPNAFRYRPLKMKKGLIAKSLQGVENAFSVAEKITQGMIKIPDRAYFQARYNTSLLDQLNARGVNTKRFQKLKGVTLSETLTNIAKPEEVEQAILEARENVFQRDCAASQFARTICSALNKVKPYKIGDWALPFIHTTSVISEDIIDRIGVGLIKGTQKIIEIRKNGGSAQELRDAYNSIAKTIIGMGIIAVGAVKGEDEEKDYTDKEITGEYSNAVNIKNVSINAKNLPFILVPHNLGKMLMSNDEQKIKKAVLKTWEAIAETNPVLSKYNEMSKKNKFCNKDEKDILDEFIADTLGVPLAQLFQNATLRNIRNITDEYDRETYVPNNKWTTLGNKFKNATPGLSQTLPKKYNAIGEEVKRNNIDNPLEKAVSAFITGHKRLKPENETYNEFKKIGKGFENTDYKGKGNIAMAKIKRGIKVNGENYKMSPEEYSNFQRDYGRINYYFRKVLSGSSFMNKDAKTFVDEINEIKQSAEEAVKITQLGHIPTKYKNGKYRLHKYTEYMLKNYDVLTQ